MHRVGKTADTPQKRQSTLEESMDGKEAITKSGRKVKRPATFDSPERITGAPAADARKSGRKAKSVSADSAGIPAAATPEKRTLKPEENASDMETSRRTIGSAKIPAASPSIPPEQKKIDEKQKKPLPEPAIDDSGISKSGRKIKVPAKLIDFESEILSSPRKTATIVQEGEAKNDAHKAATTPGRLSRVVKKRLMDDGDENQPPGVKSERTGRAKSIVAKGTPPNVGVRANSDVVESSSRAKSPSAAAPKTPKARAKPLATAKLADAETQKEDEPNDTPKTARKPGRPAGTSLKKLPTDSQTLTASEKSTSTLEKANTSSPPENGRTPRALKARAKSVAPTNIDETDAQIDRPSDAPKSGRKPGRPAGISLKTVPSESQELQLAAPAPAPAAEKENTVSTPKRGRTPGRVAGKSLLNSRLDSPVPPAPKIQIIQGTPSKPVGSVEQEKEQPTKSALKTARTPGRPRTVKSLAPATQTKPEAETSKAAEKPPAGRTPGRRVAKSLMPDSSERAEATENIPKGGATEEDRALSRSGRKIKPKKIFEIEQNEGGTSQQLEDAKVRSPAEGKKRKADEADAETSSGDKLLSPRKKVTTDKGHLSSVEPDQGDAPAVPSMPFPQLVVKKVDKGEKSATEPPTEAPKTPHKAPTSVPSKSDGSSVSRSGRKIKQKKMFGFDDDDSDGASEPSASSNVTKATTSSSSEARSQKGKQNTPIAAAEKVPPKKNVEKVLKLQSPTATVSSPRPKPMAQVSTATVKQEAADDEHVYQKNNFVTKRGMDDHRKRQTIIATDEPDRALLVDVPVVDISQAPLLSPAKKIKSPSLGVAKPAGAQQRQTTTADEGVAEAAGGKEAGSSRSGRKIKPKKFFDDDGCSVHSVVGHPPAAGEQETTKAKELAPVASPQALVDKAARKETQKEEESKVVEAMDTVEGEPENVTSNSAEGTDIAEVGVAAAPVPMEDIEKEVKESEVPPAAEGDCAQAAEELKDAGKEDDQSAHASDGRVEDPVEPEVMQQGHDVAEGPTKTVMVEQKEENTPMVVATAEEQTASQVLGEGHTEEVVSDGGGVGQQPANKTPEKDSTAELVKDSDTNVVEMATNLKEGDAPVREEPRTVDEVTAVHETSTSPNVANASVLDGSQSGEPGDDALNIHNISADSSIEELRLDENDLLIDGSFGEIEYLEDEEPNIAEHIKEHTARVASRTVSEGAAPEELPNLLATVPTIPETLLPGGRRATMDETFSPIKPDPVAAAVVVIDISETPQVGQKQPTPAATAPRTVTTSSATVGGSKFSPDKPPEIIEILDSPGVMIFNRQIDDENRATKTGSGGGGGGGGSATSTPLASKSGSVEWPAAKLNVQQQQQPAEGRKRSLSASAADTTMKRNVTFHSPANCTVLVDTIDERLVLKSLQQKEGQGEDSVKKKSGPRKRSLSDYRPGPEAEVKPSKISRKVPNFKNIHANHFNRMESIAEFMNRKEQRAKNMLTAASPATKLLARSDSSDSGASTEKKETSQKPFVFKFGGGGGGAGGGGSIPAPSASLFGLGKTTANQRPIKASNIVRPVLATAASREALAKRKAATEMRTADRLHQFKAKQLSSKDASATATASGAASTTAATTSHPVEQLRMKRSKLLKGVRTNRRFELQMKHRDTHQ